MDKEMIKDIVEAYKEARQYDDLHLYDDHIGWLKESFEKGWFEFPDEYDFDTSRWTIGICLAQLERYGGIVMRTKKGVLPLVDFSDGEPYLKDKLRGHHQRRVGKKLNE